MESRPAGEFGDGYMDIQNSQDYRALLDHIQDPHEWRDVSGAFVLPGDGEYLEIWLTNWIRPYELGTLYYRVL